MIDFQKISRYVDFPLIASVIGLIVYGSMVVYSATAKDVPGDPFFSLNRQLVWVALGIVLAMIVVVLDYNRLRNWIVPLYIAIAAVLLLVMFTGASELGAQRWIDIGAFRFQPSEFAKIIIVITLAGQLSLYKGDLSNPKNTLLAFAHVGLPLFLIYKQPDLGTALCILAITLGIIFAAGIPLRQFMVILFIGMAVVLVVFNFHLLKDYQMKRLIVFLDPDVDPLGSGYNLLQSKIAVGSGMFMGKGFMSGTQTNLRFLPMRSTDFIFAVVGEEFGFAGALALIGLYATMIIRGIRVAALSKNLFGTLLAAGIVSMWVFQILINIGMTTGIMPITGIPLPFISLGGSALMTNLLGVGILLNIYARRFV
ncbi:MAG: rod shape-determining protein RodA [Actinobacteria bacterium]|nr:rod shape-determining protein RodA [Actinomycetota bacterium]